VNNAIGTFGMSGNQGTTRPAAYLNYIIFDQQYKVINMGWTVVPTSANFARQRITVNAPQIKEPGFVFVYLSYENAGTTMVNFDDIKVTHTRNNIIQYNEYYAFQQTTANSWTRENVTGNNFLGNGGTEVNPTTQLYDLDFRNYDPLLGRMTQVDPMATKYASLTPYNYSFNDPVTFTDVNGADPDNGCTLCEPIFQPYTGFQYSNSYGGFVQDDVIYYRQSGWTGPVHRYRGSALYMDQNVAPGGSGAWTTQLMMSFADEARRSGNINWFAGMFGMRFGGGINGLTDGLASLGLSLVPNKPPEPPIRPAIDPKELVASKTGLYHVPDERPAPVDLFDPNVNKIEGILNHLYYIGHNRGKQHHLRDIIKSFKEPVPWWKSVLGRIGLYGPNNSFNGRGKISGIDVEWGVQVAGTHTSEKWRTSKGNMNLTLLAQAVEGRSFVDGQSTTVYQIVLYRGNNNLVYLNFLNKDAWNKIYNYITGSP
jgi:RHS repeat-associated protein